MNVKFYNAISNMKTNSNAAIIEAIKNLYVVCEGIANPVASTAFLESAGEYLSKQESVLPGATVSTSKGTATFDLPNGKARITIANFENAIVEVSPLAEAQFYPIGVTKLADGIGISYKAAVDALNDKAMMEGFMSKLIKKAAPYALAGAAAIGATGCAGNQFKYDSLINEQTGQAEQNWTPEQSENLFNHLGVKPSISPDGTLTVTSNDISTIVEKIANDSKDAVVERANDDTSNAYTLNELNSIPSYKVAQVLRDKIANNDIKVVSSYGENPNIQQNSVLALDRAFEHAKKQSTLVN